MIPEGWTDVELGEVATFKGGSGFKEKFQGKLSGDLPFIKVSDMNLPGNEECVRYSQNWVSKGEAKEMRATPMPARSIVFAKVGAALLLNRRRRLIMPTIIDNNMMAAIPNEKRITSDYLYRLLTTIDLGKFAQASAVPSVNQQHLSEILAFLPPVDEQSAINNLLQTWDRAIETVEALIANARAQKQALMQQLLPQGSTQPKKRLPGFSGEWRKLHIGDVAKEVSERAGEQTSYPVLSCSKYDGMVESLSYFKKKVYSDDASNYKVMRRGTFGFPSNHVEEGSIGYQDLCDAGIVSPIYCVFATSNEVDNGFLYKLLKTDRYRQIFAAATNASVDRRGSLRWKEFSRIPLPLPPLEEQRAISEAVDAVAATETAYQAQLTALRQEKAALMQQLLTGKRRVKLPESEVV